MSSCPSRGEALAEISAAAVALRTATLQTLGGVAANGNRIGAAMGMLSNYLGLILVILTAISGILGAFFSKKGDREKISGIGWIIIIVTILLATVTVWKYISDEIIKLEKEASAEQKIQDRDNKIASLGQELQKSNNMVKNITSYSILNFFDANRSASRIQIVFDVLFDEAGNRGLGPIDGPSALSNKNRTNQRIEFTVGDFGHLTIEYSCDYATNYCSVEKSESYKAFQKNACKNEKDNKKCDMYYVEDLGNTTSYGFIMPSDNVSPPRAFNQISKNKTVASFIYIDQKNNREKISDMFRSFNKISIMIFQEYSGQAKKVNDGCIKFATIDLQPKIYIKDNDLIVELVHNNEYDLDMCFSL